jgi:MFS family permease
MRSPDRPGLVSLAGLLVLIAATFGASYSFPALSERIAEELGVARSVVQGAVAVWFLTAAVASPVGGMLCDRVGTRATLILAGLALSSGLTGLALASAPVAIYLTFGLLAALGYSLVVVVATVAASRSHQPGTALGTVGASIGIGLIVIVPAATVIADQAGWRVVFGVLAAAILVLSGLSASMMSTERSSVVSRDAEDDGALPRGPLIRAMAAFVAIAVVDEAIYQHLVADHRSRGFAAGEAAFALGCASLGFIGGQALGGVAMDRVARARVIVPAALGMAVSLLGLAAPGAFGPRIVGAAALFGLSLGASLAARSATVAAVFRGRYLATVIGCGQLAYAVGGGLIGWGGAAMVEAGWTYGSIYGAALAATALWSLAIMSLPMPDRRPALSAPQSELVETARLTSGS